MNDISTPLISIITPVYNCEKYLNSCVDSILSQTYHHFELLLIDDGSNDKSSQICDEYSNIDNRVRVFHKSNEGVSSARNVGLENANGDWIFFVDSDDLLYNDALEYAISLISGNDVDFVVAGYDYLQDDKIIYSTNYVNKSVCVYSKHLGLRQMYIEQFWPWFICSKLFRRSLLMKNKIIFDNNIFFGEDRLFIMQYINVLDASFVFSVKSIYKYRIHGNSAEGKTWNSYGEKNITGLYASKKMYEIVLKMDTYIYNKYLALSDFVNSYHTQKKLLKRCKHEQTKYNIQVNQVFFSVIPRYKYYIFLIIRKIEIKWRLYKRN